MSDKPRILQALRLLPWLEAQLAQDYEVVHLPAEPQARQQFLKEQGADFGLLVTSAAHGIGNDVLEALPKLRMISSFGVGLDKFDLGYIGQRGMALGYTPDVLNDCVADQAFGLMLDIGRRLSQADRYVRAGQWGAPGAPAFPLGFKVSGARLGIVGLGRIGSTIARRASGFDMDVRYHSRKPVADQPWTYEPSLHELARWSDFLVVITSGGAGTHHLIDQSVLDALGPQGFLINVSRGSVVHEAALLSALQDKRIGGAALDVFEREPHVPSDFYSLDNVVMVPHIASATVQTRQAMAQRVLDNLRAHQQGLPLPSSAFAV